MPDAPSYMTSLSGLNDLGNRLLTGLYTGIANIPLLPANVYSTFDNALRAYQGTDEQVLPGADAMRRASGYVDDTIRDYTGTPQPTNLTEFAVEQLPGLIPAPITALGKLGAVLPLPFAQATSLPGRLVEGAAPLGFYGLIKAAEGEEAEAATPPAPPAPELLRPATATPELPLPATAPTPLPAPLPGPTTPPQVTTPSGAAISTPPPVTQPQPPPPATTGRPAWVNAGEEWDDIPAQPAWVRPGEQWDAAPVRPADTVRADAQLGIAPEQAVERDYKKALIYGGLAALSAVGLAGNAKAMKAQRRDVQGDYAGAVKTGEGPQTSAPREEWLGTENITGQVTDAGTAILTQTVDKNAPLHNAFKKLLTPAQASKLDAAVQTSNTAALTAKTDDFYKTGRLPGSKLRTSKPLAETLAKSATLSEQELKDLNDLATLRTRLDTSKSKGFVGWGSGATKIDHQMLVGEIQRISSRNPKVVALADELAEIHRVIPKYLEEQGFITHKSRLEWEENNPNYVPQRIEWSKTLWQSARDMMYGDSTGRVGVRGKPDWSIERATEEGAIQPGQVGDVRYASAAHFSDMIHTVTQNKLRADIISSMDGIRVPGYAKPVVEVLQPGVTPNKGEYATTVRIAGENRDVIIRDPGVYSALQMRARMTAPYVGTLTNLASKFITGPLNPLFLLKHIQYETIGSLLNLPSKRRLGLLPGVNLSSFDPTALAAVPAGAYRQLWGTLSYSGYLAARTDLFQNGWMTKTFGQQNVETFAKLMQEGYERSSASLAERYGGLGQGRYAAADTADRFSSALDHVAGFAGAKGNYWRTTAPYQTYMGLYNAIRDGGRLQYFAANVPRKLVIQRGAIPIQIGGRTFNLPNVHWAEKDTPDFMVQLGAETRNLTGDSARLGGDTGTLVGRSMQYGMSSVMYGNQSVQTFAQMGRAFKDHPVRFASTAAAMVYGATQAYMLASETEEGRQLIRDMAPEQRARAIPITGPDGQFKMFIAPPPEFRPFIAAALAATLAAAGVLDPSESEGATDARRAFKDSLTQDVMLDFVRGPAVEGLLALFGQELRDPNSLETSTEREGRYDKFDDPDMIEGAGDFAYRVMDATIGASLTMIMDGVRQFYNAAEYNDRHPDRPPTDPFDLAAKAIIGPMRENKTASLAAPLWGLETRVSKGDFAQKKVSEARVNIKRIIDRGNDTVRGRGATTSLSRPQLEDQTGLVPSEAGGDFARVYVITNALSKRLVPMSDEYAQLTAKEDALSADPRYADAKIRLPVFNGIARRKSALNEAILGEIRESERILKEMVDPEFSYDSYGG